MKGGEHATARRSHVREDAAFIRSQVAKGVPVSAIARMVGRCVTDVRGIAATPDLKARERPVVLVVPPSSKPRPTGPQPRPKPPRVRSIPQRALAIIQPIADFYGVRLDELIGPSQVKALSEVRQEAYAALHDTGHFSSPVIASYFGGRDHTTVLHGIAKHRERMAALEEARAEA